MTFPRNSKNFKKGAGGNRDNFLGETETMSPLEKLNDVSINFRISQWLRVFPSNGHQHNAFRTETSEIWSVKKKWSGVLIYPGNFSGRGEFPPGSGETETIYHFFSNSNISTVFCPKEILLM